MSTIATAAVLTVQADDEEATVRHCPWCASVWIQRKDRS